MPYVSALANALHALAAVVWVGGMFFAYMVLRPAVGGFEAPARLALWDRVFRRFFTWVWLAVIVLPATGYWALFVGIGGFAKAPLHVHLMHGIGLVMIGLFVFLYVVPFRSFGRAVAAQAWPEGGKQLGVIRRIVAVNLSLGLVTAAVGSSGRLWG